MSIIDKMLGGMDFTALQAQVEAFFQHAERLTAQVNQLRGEVSQLRTDMSQLRGELQSMRSTLQRIEQWTMTNRAA